MNKTNLLAELRTGLTNGVITEAELRELIIEAESAESGSIAAWLSRAFYYLGGGVVFLGLVFLAAEQWDELAIAGRIALTLGAGVGALVAGILSSGHPKLGAAGPAFLLLSALLLPLGLAVTWHELGENWLALSEQVKISAILTVIYIPLYGWFRQTLLGAAALVFATWLFFALTNWLAVDAWYLDANEFNAYRVMGIGLSYLLIGYWMAGSKNPFGWARVMNLGAAVILGAAFSIIAKESGQHIAWELFYPFLIYAFVHLSGLLQERSLLWISALALGAYLTRLTMEYFSDSLGWALSLVIIGFILMTIAYFTLRYSRRLDSPS